MIGPVDGSGAALPSPRRLAAILVVLYAAALVLWTFSRLPLHGWEMESVARSLVGGHGYSFPLEAAWLEWHSRPGTYVPTAWTDPLSTLLYAGLLFTFGEQGPLVMALVSIACVIVGLWQLAHLASRHVHPWAAPLAVLLFAAVVTVEGTGIRAAPLAMLLLTLLFARMETPPTLRNAAVLGLLLGMLVLTWSATQPFLLLVPLLWWWRHGRGGILPILWVWAVVMLVVTPWAVRNALVFDRFVPFRTGSGLILHTSTVALAGTFEPSVTTPWPPPPVRTGSAWEAVSRVIEEGATIRGPLEAWEHELVRQRFGEARVDEATKDAWLREEALRFCLERPDLVLQMAWPKLWHFLARSPGARASGLGFGGALIVSILAVIGTLARWRDPPIRMAAVLVVAYSTIFLLITPYFYRYRMPVEPLFAFLATAGAMHLARLAIGRNAPERSIP